MTHDEMIHRIQLNIEDKCPSMNTKGKCEFGCWNCQISASLLAILELHKPKEEDGKLWCEHEVCYNHIEFLERDDCDCSYPCSTIQAIEKAIS